MYRNPSIRYVLLYVLVEAGAGVLAATGPAGGATQAQEQVAAATGLAAGTTPAQVHGVTHEELERLSLATWTPRITFTLDTARGAIEVREVVCSPP